MVIKKMIKQKKECEQLLSNNEKGGAEIMEKIQENVMITSYKDFCPICHKEIKGSKESQVRYNLKIHMNAQHGTAIVPTSEEENAK